VPQAQSGCVRSLALLAAPCMLLRATTAASSADAAGGQPPGLRDAQRSLSRPLGSTQAAARLDAPRRAPPRSTPAAAHTHVPNTPAVNAPPRPTCTPSPSTRGCMTQQSHRTPFRQLRAA
jgi:hypothetical protein